jgi:hypothetical protein
MQQCRKAIETTANKQENNVSLVWIKCSRIRQFGALRSHGRTEQKCEVHEVELTWSLKSGKVKLVWNGKDLSRLVSFTFMHMPNNLFLEFEWVIPSGSTFRGIAHAFPNRAKHQYELFIDGTAISLLFPLEILVEKLRNKIENARKTNDDQRSQCEDEAARVNADILECCDVDDNFVDSKVECSLVSSGISKGVTCEDALRSDLYSSTLDLLRETLSSCVPYTEEMISRAIIYAFSDDSGTDLTAEFKGTEHTLDVGVVEADALGESLAWLQWNQDSIAVADLQDRKMEFLRKQVEWMVFQVRHSRLDALLASQILHRVATVLNLKLTKQPSSDTLLIWNLKPSTLTQDLKEALKEYGKITGVAVSKQHADFGTLFSYMQLVVTLSFYTYGFHL